jgi:hypothetical protein
MAEERSPKIERSRGFGLLLVGLLEAALVIACVLTVLALAVVAGIGLVLR